MMPLHGRRVGWRCPATLVALLIVLTGHDGRPRPRSGTLAAQEPAARPLGEPQVFRSGVDLIEIDTFVTDEDGQLVRGLTADDFEIVEDGTPQPIVTFAFFDLPVPAAGPRPARPPAMPEADIATNDVPEGRIYVLLLDAPSTAGASGGRRGPAYNAYVKRLARQFIEETVTPGDVAAVVLVMGTFDDAQPFTTSRRLLLTAIEHYGRGRTGDQMFLSGAERVSRNLETYRLMKEVAERLGAMSGRRKAILWIGGQVAFDPTHSGCYDANSCAIRGGAPALLAAYREAIGTATRHNVAIYPIDPSGLTTTLGMAELRRAAALRMMAEDTGGLAVVGTNNFAEQFAAIARDTGTYYVLGYAPATIHRDGRFHPVQVRVKRPGLRVRARPGYLAPLPDAAAPVLPPPPEGVSEAAREALRMPVSVRGLAIDLVTASFRDGADGTAVTLGGQLRGDLRLAPGARVALAYQVFTTENTIAASGYRVFTLDLPPEAQAHAATAGLRFVEQIPLPAGRYEVRLAADQPDGGVGSVVTTIEVPGFADALALSGVVLAAASAEDHVTLGEAPALRAALGGLPTAIRRFAPGEALTALAEVYANDPRVAASPLTVTATLATSAGRVVREVPASLAPLEAAAGQTGAAWRAVLDLSLAGLPAGEYVLTVEAASRQARQPARRQVLLVVED